MHSLTLPSLTLTLFFFIDDSAVRNPTDGSPCVSYEICTNHDIVESTNIPNNLSVLAAFFSFPFLGPGIISQ